jgi:hypothetical protein
MLGSFIRSDVIRSDVIRSVFIRSDVIRSDVIRSVIIRSVGESHSAEDHILLDIGLRTRQNQLGLERTGTVLDRIREKIQDRRGQGKAR